jgi:phytoene dehydrogenase-like protein
MTACLADHFNQGGFYPTGGSVTLAENIVPIILAAGGGAFVRAPVSHIILNASGTEALGVHCRGEDIFAPCVISAAGVMNTYFKLIRAEDDKLGNQKQVCPHAEEVRRHLHVVIPPKDGTKDEATGTHLHLSHSFCCHFVCIIMTSQSN